jgi:primosomal protein N' (replication factor Y)
MFGDSSQDAPDRVVEVLLPLALPGAYSYLVPQGMAVTPGDYVRVPLGPRQVFGVVWDSGEDGAAAVDRAKLRGITERLDVPSMPDLHRRFIDWVATYTMSSPGAVLRMCLRVPEALGPERVRTGYRLGGPVPQRMTPQRTRVLEEAHEELARSAADLADAAGVSTGVIKGLVDAGTLSPVSLPAFARFKRPDPAAGGVTLSSIQQAAAQLLRGEVAGRAFSVSLLDGVTGAGKMEVYLEAVAATIAAGHQVLVLLPEIALTTDFMQRFERRFAAAPAEWHSAVRPRERERVWRAVASGEARIVVGARSALFLPFADLALIVVDEEHEAAYKQDDGVCYHARDMAVVRGSLGAFPVVLSSATPSLETMFNVDSGRYRSVPLTARHGGAGLPEIVPLDMRKLHPPTGTWISEPLAAAITETLDDGDQVLLYLNRRGYAPLTLCRTCGHRFQCPDCDAWLVEHRFRRHLLCHHCGFKVPVPNVCPSCEHEGTLVACGPGVERLATEVRERFGDRSMAILSSDLTRGAALRELLRDIKDRAYDIIVGTQLVAKGHHFPNLTLVGVVDGDIGLNNGDLRAAERTYQVLCQVAGRAGRGDKPGRAIIQTFQPEHPLMAALVARNRDGFYTYEMRSREQGELPPYGRFAALVLSGPDEATVTQVAHRLARSAPRAEHMRVLGPAPAPLALVRGRYRMRFLIKARRDSNVQGFLHSWLDPIKLPGSVRLQVDIDPYSFM